MGELFNFDNKFFRILSKAVDCMGLSVIWLICALPSGFSLFLTFDTKGLIFLVPFVLCSGLGGAATTALYYSVNKSVRHSRGYVTHEFWHSFRSSFKQSAVISMIVTLAGSVLGVDAYIMYIQMMDGRRTGPMVIVFLLMLLLELAWIVYLFPSIARFETTTKQAMKNAALIAVANFPKTLLMLLIFVAVGALSLVIPVLLLFAPAVYMLLINLIMEKIFLRYMSEEDIAAEEERNREFYN